MARPVANHRGYFLLGLVLSVLGGAFGYGVGHFAARYLGDGFSVDWYRYSPPAVAAPADVALVVGAVALVVGALMAPFGLALASREFARRLRKADAPPLARDPRGRASASLNQFLLHAVLVPGLLLLLTYAGLAQLGLEAMKTPEALALLVPAAAALAGALAAGVAFAATLRGLGTGRIVPGEDADNAFAKIALFSGRNAKTTIGALLVVTLLLGSGLAQINTNVDVADVLPRGNPNTDAAKNLTEKFKSSFTLQVTFQLRVADNATYDADAGRHLPYRTTEADAGNISDEVYVRAIDELVTFVKTYEDPEHGKSPFVSSITLADFYRLINWTIAGGIDAPPESYALPDPSTPAGAAQFSVVDRGVWTAIPTVADALISPNFDQTAVLVTVASTETMSSKEIGNWALRLREEYVEYASENPDAYKVFTGENAPKFSVDLPIANAHASELAGKDFKTLLPIIAVWLVVCIFLAFRNLSSIVIALSALALSVVWTFGLMGHMGIPLNTLNLTVIPLIMGVGIDYAIHTLNEYQESRAHGRSNAETFKRLGARGFLALFIATLNTVVGLLVMVVSPSLLIAQLGILAAIAISSSFLITITFMPAALSLVPEAKAHQYSPSPLMGGVARAVSKSRWLVAVVVLLVTAAAYQAQATDIEEFGDPPRNWLPSDPLRQEHEAAIAGFYSDDPNVKANILIFEGDITDPASHAYMDAIEQSLIARGVGRALADAGAENGTEGRIITDTLRTLPYLVRTYLTIRDGADGAGEYMVLQQLIDRQPAFQSQDPYPTTKEEMKALLDEVHSTPLGSFANLFYDHPDDRMAMMVFSVKAASYEDASEVWHQVQAAVAENEELRPDGMQVSFFGNTAINYLFVAEELPWVFYMSVVTNVLVLAFVYIPTRQIRPTLVVGLLNFVVSFWWLAVLPFLGVGLAITLTLPLVFIFAIGSDYGLHLVLSAQDTKDTEETFRTTGKAILFSAITTFGAFLIYTQMSNLAVRRTMIATAAAIPIILLVTVLVVPMLYPVGRKDKPPLWQRLRSRAKEPKAGKVVSMTPTAPGAPPAPKPRRVIVEMPPPKAPKAAPGDGVRR